MRRAALLVASFFAAAALAQTATESKPPEKTPEPAATERPRLNLKLDKPSSFATMAPEEKAARKALPTLGSDARPLPPSGVDSSNPTFPKDTAPGH